MHWDALEFSCLFVFNARLKLILDILGSSFLYHIFLLYMSSFFCRVYLAFLASYSQTNLVNLSLPHLMYLLRPTIAALHADSSFTNPCPLFCLLAYSLLQPAFRWWIPSLTVKSFSLFDPSFQFLSLISLLI